MARNLKSVVVTGVSTGIGYAIARYMIDRGWRVFGSVRKKQDAERLKSELGPAFIPLTFDVTDPEAVRAGAETVRQILCGETLGGLVNNAGVALGGPMTQLPLETFRKQLDVNLVGTVATVQAFAPLLGADKTLSGAPGRIVNMGSVGGRHAFPFMVPYHVSKYGMEGLSEGLRRELMLYDIDVILVAPGAVSTPIWSKADTQGFDKYQGTEWERPLSKMAKTLRKMDEDGLAPERIARVVHKALIADKPRVYYRVTDSELQFQALTKLPKRLVDRVIAKALDIKAR